MRHTAPTVNINVHYLFHNSQGLLLSSFMNPICHRGSIASLMQERKEKDPCREPQLRLLILLVTLCFHCSRAIVANTVTPLSFFQSEYRCAAGEPPRRTPAEAASLSGLSPELGCLACVLPKMYRGGAKLRRGVVFRAGRTTALVSIVCFCPREAYTAKQTSRQNKHLPPNHAAEVLVV